MSIKIAINHKTRYDYDRIINLGPQVLRLRPAAHSRTKIENYSLNISPKDYFINWQQDPFGNYLARIVFEKPTNFFEIEVDIIAKLQTINAFDFFVEDYAKNYGFEYEQSLKKELGIYLEQTENGILLNKLVDQIDKSKIEIVPFLVKINVLLSQLIKYNTRLEHGVQDSEETLKIKSGSCRDSSWLLVQIMRKLGIASRFVSGYLVQLKSDQKSLDGKSGPEEDFTDLHAWCEVYIPGAGWIGLDPTSGLFATEGHIPLACTAEPNSAAPISGLLDPCQTTFSFSNKVTRILEDPRVTKPYTDEQWNAINALGKLVDRDLHQNDARLTMGGEPTFVSIDDMEGEEWNSTADGKLKRTLSYDLLIKLQKEFSTKSLLHFGQGKWYPGELLPRWKYTLIWDKSGKPIWENQNLLADITKDYGYKVEESEKFSKLLIQKLNLNETILVTAFEDIYYYLWSEGKIPLNIDATKKNLKDPIERQFLADLLNDGLEKPVGFVIPIEFNEINAEWQSSIWAFRKKQLYLTPGNSPIGLRLPLDQLEEIKDDKTNEILNKDLFDITTLDQEVKINPKIVDNHVVKSAFSIECREGKLFVFFPPIGKFNHYLKLLNLVEETAFALNLKIVIEGYEPPRDNEIESLVITPDPGVIEVNVQPAKNWDEVVINYEKLFVQARLSRLSTEKFMNDGRHTGTGGGNHITLGGAKPSDSPLLRRPDLLRSLITYWQHHPGLSYLFAGSFIGPTSQAPRVDEGREDRLYELEIAFSNIPEDEEVPFWLVDRLLRHLLTDVTGNTHRSEFCIDKLYSPDSSSGRLGILEFRAFDMPPHHHMCMLQLLLIRALVSMFWKKPYKGKLIRWGSQLHDRFLLPEYCMRDMQEVVKDLNDTGYPFQYDWLAPFYEFRFPVYGSVQIENCLMEVRFAIEPWHVLGEETTSSGTARYVDSSVEKVQIKVNGFTPERHVILCNGKRVNLTPTGKAGEFVAGIRHKAWNPPSALHPTVKAQAQLTFDLVDTYHKRSIGGCNYFVSHPGGRSYSTLPVNSYEAESRRNNRFWEIGHTPDTIQINENMQSLVEFIPNYVTKEITTIPTENIDDEHPYTLDLRKK